MDIQIGDFTIAGVLIIATALVWLLVDVYLYLDPKKETISARMLQWSKHMMAIVFLAGFIAGHFWW